MSNVLFVVVVVALSLALSPQKVLADDFASRAFEGIGTHDLDVLRVSIVVFDNEDRAQTFFADAMSGPNVAAFDDQYIIVAPDLTGIRSQVQRAPDVGDETFYHQTFLGGGHRADLLLVRKANIVYDLNGRARGDPLPDMLTVFHNIETRSSSDAQDLLPDADDLPYPMTQVELDPEILTDQPCNNLGRAISNTYRNIIRGEVRQTFRLNGQDYFPDQVAGMSENEREELATSWLVGIGQTLGEDAAQLMIEYEANRESCLN